MREIRVELETRVIRGKIAVRINTVDTRSVPTMFLQRSLINHLLMSFFDRVAFRNRIKIGFVVPVTLLKEVTDFIRAEINAVQIDGGGQGRERERQRRKNTPVNGVPPPDGKPHRILFETAVVKPSLE